MPDLEEDKDAYVVCEICSKERGKIVRYHEFAIKTEEFFLWGGKRRTCPKGHELKAEEKK